MADKKRNMRIKNTVFITRMVTKTLSQKNCQTFQTFLISRKLLLSPYITPGWQLKLKHEKIWNSYRENHNRFLESERQFKTV